MPRYFHLDVSAGVAAAAIVGSSKTGGPVLLIQGYSADAAKELYAGRAALSPNAPAASRKTSTPATTVDGAAWGSQRRPAPLTMTVHSTL